MVVFPEMLPDFPAPGECQRIGTIKDLIIRNLNVTQGYSEIARAFASRVPGRVNWSGFATWASKQAGNSIRSEDMLRLALRDFGGPAGLPAGKLVGFDAVSDALAKLGPFRRASDSVSAGNVKVFVEIGAELSRFLIRFADGPEGLDEFCEGLKPGPPPDGQDLLKLAFRQYHRAWFSFDPQQRDESLLFGNLLVGVHEQTRLQPEIEGAMNAASVDPDELCACLPAPPTMFRPLLRTFCGKLAGHVRKVVTNCMMTITLPGPETLRLGHDLRAKFPENLRSLRDPELRAFAAKVDPTPDSLRGSGARDWADFAQRMHFIADLFRAYHASPLLLSPPYDADRERMLKAGVRPPDPL
jgi:hypothetical protein